MKIIHTMPLLIRGDSSYNEDLRMAKNCFESLQSSDDNFVVIYNQGCLSNDELNHLLSSFQLPSVILGNGTNVGIAKARQTCFEYIWNHFKEVHYISEIHVDMVFPRNWYEPLLDLLENSDEPMISPGILTQYGELQPIGNSAIIPETIEELIKLLEDSARNEVHEGFVHPVVHKANALREIGGYDTRFIKGKQGYEDDSLLVGYLYYMGTRTNWRPKCYLKSLVYHATMAQRMSLPDKHLDFDLNGVGLFFQHGAHGLKQLSKIHKNATTFDLLLEKFSQIL
ncbi:glycosyltransferase [Paenibacillus whitsoniae]|uniref:Glycosyltransferase n=1 Tax=Paenibacillus whitsoniae TaxID=2496558 RepID=A0A430J495_9BACL|nr:glycosyltransferase [Paenibacillus whitsoniae]RTE00421.1 glycosyltransferase [Paenibacillus whitsoniae]